MAHLFMKKIPVEFAVNSFMITSESLPLPKNDYGSFFAFILPNMLDSSLVTQITNRCYVGYSNNGSFYSFVHGNEIAKLIKLENNNYDFNNATSAINEHKKIANIVYKKISHYTIKVNCLYTTQ